MSAHPASPWTHPICDKCWSEREPEREPHRLVEDARESERCCFCGTTTTGGIYIREDPSFAAFCSRAAGR